MGMRMLRFCNTEGLVKRKDRTLRSERGKLVGDYKNAKWRCENVGRLTCVEGLKLSGPKTFVSFDY